MRLITDRQAEAASLFHAGYSNRDIASMLDIERRAVRRLRQRAAQRLQKFGLAMPEAPNRARQGKMKHFSQLENKRTGRSVLASLGVA